MVKALLLSIGIHTALVAALYWSNQLDLFFLKKSQKELKAISAVLLMDATYKPTDTAMKQGVQKKDLPPPKVEDLKKSKSKSDEKPALLKKEAEAKNIKKNIKDILKNIRDEAKKEPQRRPKEDNFPMNEKGEKKAHGTGGRGDRALSPAEQALQAAMGKYYEAAFQGDLKKLYPNAVGYVSVKLVGVGSQFEIVSLNLRESTGIDIIDSTCEIAVRRAMQNERFNADVIRDLNGKETTVICRP